MRKKHPEHVNLERWLVSYADFITMMFAFFVVLWATSRADVQKYAAVAQSLKNAFGVAGAPYGMVERGGGGGSKTLSPFDAIEATGGRNFDLPAGKVNAASESDPDSLQGLRDKLEDSISLELGVSSASERLQMTYDSRGLVLRIAAKDFFGQGQVEARQDMRPLLDRIARVLVTSSKIIRIEGHIDSSEKNPEGYASGWELSAARAAWVTKYFLGRYDFDPRRVGVAGYAHYRPVADSRGEYDRAANRRVEIIVLNNEYEQEPTDGAETVQ